MLLDSEDRTHSHLDFRERRTTAATWRMVLYRRRRRHAQMIAVVIVDCLVERSRRRCFLPLGRYSPTIRALLGQHC